jgi:hypothetical protein
MESETRIICDFCSSENVVYRYPCYDDAITVECDGTALDIGSLGDWASCGHCAAIIDAGNRSMLIDRSVDSFIAEHGTQNLSCAELEYMITGIHSMFWAMRHGQKICITGVC